MGIALQQMEEKEYSIWFDNHVQRYAQDKIRAKQWSEQIALEQAKRDTQRLLTAGVHTENHHLCHIVETEMQVHVGSIWWCLSERFGYRTAFIFDLHILNSYRRNGYARMAMRALEKMVKKEGVQSISLHVFAFNTGAHNLYEALGYQPSSIVMRREI